MSEHLGELLELLYGARNRFRTARGVVVSRHSMRLTTEGMRRERRRQRRFGGGSMVQFAFATSESDEPAPDIHEEHTRFWWEPPDRLREESERQTRVVDGELWWVSMPDLGAISNAGLDEDARAEHRTGGGEEFRLLLDPSGMIGLLDFDRIDDEGDVFRVGARLRDDTEDSAFHLRVHFAPGADRIELVVDRRRGVLLRRASYLDDEEMSSVELGEIAFDEDFPSETFVFVPPSGVEVRSPEDAHRRYTLEEAIAEAPFTVFLLGEAPAGFGDPHVSYHDHRSFGGPLLALFYHRTRRGSLILTQTSAGRKLGWPGVEPKLDEVERDGVVYTTCASDPELGTPAAVGVERDGTAVRLQSDVLGIDELLELASGLAATPAAS